MTSKREEMVSYVTLVMPALIIYLAVMAFPIIFSVLLSVSNYNGGKVFGNPDLKFFEPETGKGNGLFSGHDIPAQYHFPGYQRNLH